MSPRHLYVHVPFCGRRCTYCDFSIAVRRVVPVAAYLAALAREATVAGGPDGAVSPEGLATVYLGGGTPSRLGGEGIAALAARLRLPGALAEFTIEANPEDVTPEAVRAWVGVGVNRLSVGAQSFDDAVLRWMHRTHDAARIAEAVHAARRGGLGNLSLDLIFALPEALGRDWRRDLDAAIALEPDHVSLYGLTVEHGTPLFRMGARGEARRHPTPATRTSTWSRTNASPPRGTPSTRCRTPRARAARRCTTAPTGRWRPTWGWDRRRTASTAPPDGGTSRRTPDGCACSRPAGAPWPGREMLGDEQRRLERLYLGLRTREGIGLQEPCPPKLRAAVDRWVAAGWAVVEPPAPVPPRPGAPVPAATVPPRPGAPVPAATRIRLTPTGWLRLDELVATV